MDAHTLTVELGDRSYPIVIGAGLIAGGLDFEDRVTGDDCLLVSNETVAPLYLDGVTACLPNKKTSTLVLPDGEVFKTVSTANTIIDALVSAKAGRDTTVVAVGGGVVGDIAGFAAACYMRGVSFVQVPTTLLAQVDSSVGGKTGVNHEGGKNLVGAFHQPRIVIIDIDTLSTLPDREYRAGLAEVIKYGAIVDRTFFSWLEENMGALLQRDPIALVHAIRRSCEIKAEVVAQDEREAGKRALLNFGHTFGHAIENTMGYGEWLHGEAVAAGMVMATAMSGLSEADTDRIESLIAAAGLPTAPPSTGVAQLLEAMQLDKKARGSALRFVLLRELGDAYFTAEYEQSMLDHALQAAAS
jgi:3-dehydroquinate synthase